MRWQCNREQDIQITSRCCPSPPPPLFFPWLIKHKGKVKTPVGHHPSQDLPANTASGRTKRSQASRWDVWLMLTCQQRVAWTQAQGNRKPHSTKPLAPTPQNINTLKTKSLRNCFRSKEIQEAWQPHMIVHAGLGGKGHFLGQVAKSEW